MQQSFTAELKHDSLTHRGIMECVFESHNYDNTQNYSRNQSNFSGTPQQNGVSLYIKANNVTEDILRSIFNANVSQAKIISIDVKLKWVELVFSIFLIF